MYGEEFLFILVVTGFLALWFAKLTNVLTGGRLYSDVASWVGLILGVLLWGFGLGLVMTGGDSFLYFSVIFRFVNVFFVVFWLFQIIEAIYLVASKGVNVDGRQSGFGVRSRP